MTPRQTGEAAIVFSSVAEAAAWAGALRASGQRLVVTNGCFDLLHAGHARYLREARASGDALLVGLNDDASVRDLKGPGRPLVTAEERAELLAALRWVDAVAVFSGRTAEDLVHAVRPALYVKGGDYARAGAASDIDLERLPEARVVHAQGGQVVLLPYHGGRSTTSLIARIRGLAPR